MRQLSMFHAPERKGRECEFPGCEAPQLSRGLCGGHYSQRRIGRTLTPLRQRRASREPMRFPDGSKTCTNCEVRKPPSEFQKDTRQPDGIKLVCRECVSDAVLDQKHGKGAAQWKREQFERQGSVCEICGTDDPGTPFWHLDHDHSKQGPESWRWVLCHNCNANGVGWIEGIPIERRGEALAFLDRHFNPHPTSRTAPHPFRTKCEPPSDPVRLALTGAPRPLCRSAMR